MPEFLGFRLYGVMAGWGDERNVGELRETAVRPTKSALIGFLGACLGIERDDHVRQRVLVGSIGHAVRIDAPGEHLRDFHTVQAAWNSKKIRGYRTRHHELRSKAGLATQPTIRDYRSDVGYTILLWQTGEVSLASLGEAISRPVFTPYLGRKSCPLGLPPCPVLVEADTMIDAFAAYDRTAPTHNEKRFVAGREIRFEDGMPGGLPASLEALTFRRETTDVPVSRRGWTFQRRMETVLVLNEEREAV